MDDLEKASEELFSQWTDKRSQRDQSADEHFKQMLQTLEGMAKEHVKGQRSTFSWMPTANARRKDGPEGWSIDALEDSLLDRKKLVSAALSETVGGQDLMFASLLVDQNLDESLEGRSIASLLLQGDGAPPTSLASLLPLPIPLRPRKSRRCRAELKEGRPGILLKPKLNPLEGDSSLRTGHSQWWKKVWFAEIFILLMKAISLIRFRIFRLSRDSRILVRSKSSLECACRSMLRMKPSMHFSSKLPIPHLARFV